MTLKQNTLTTLKLITSDLGQNIKLALVLGLILTALRLGTFSVPPEAFGPANFVYCIASIFIICKWHQICLKHFGDMSHALWYIDELAYFMRAAKSGLIFLVSAGFITFLVYGYISVLPLWLALLLALPALGVIYFILIALNSLFWRYSLCLPHTALGFTSHPEINIHNNAWTHHHFLLLTLTLVIITLLNLLALQAFQATATLWIASAILAFTTIAYASLLNAAYRQYCQPQERET